jgi:hypothetical protein
MGELIDKAKGKAKQVGGKKGKAKGAFEELKTDAKRALRSDDDDADEARRAREVEAEEDPETRR